MAKIEDLDAFLCACRGRNVYVAEADARFRRCVEAAIRNGFGESDLSGLESASDRKFVLRREIPAGEVGSYASTLRTLIRDFEEYQSDPESFLSVRTGRASRRFRRIRRTDPQR